MNDHIASGVRDGGLDGFGGQILPNLLAHVRKSGRCDQPPLLHLHDVPAKLVVDYPHMLRL